MSHMNLVFWSLEDICIYSNNNNNLNRIFDSIIVVQKISKLHSLWITFLLILCSLLNSSIRLLTHEIKFLQVSCCRRKLKKLNNLWRNHNGIVLKAFTVTQTVNIWREQTLQNHRITLLLFYFHTMVKKTIWSQKCLIG